VKKKCEKEIVSTKKKESSPRRMGKEKRNRSDPRGKRYSGQPRPCKLSGPQHEGGESATTKKKEACGKGKLDVTKKPDKFKRTVIEEKYQVSENAQTLIGKWGEPSEHEASRGVEGLLTPAG